MAVNVAAAQSGAGRERIVRPRSRGIHRGRAAARGLLEQSHGGTIFLDEVADIPPALQVKLLRAVEHGEVLPVGAGRPIRIDLRVISATHQNLLDHVPDGTFRHDLYFRLSTFQIDVPPLRARRDDIQPAGRAFFGERWRRKTARRRRGFRPKRWPSWSSGPGMATSANCAMRWSMR